MSPWQSEERGSAGATLQPAEEPQVGFALFYIWTSLKTWKSLVCKVWSLLVIVSSPKVYSPAENKLQQRGYIF